MARSLLIPSSMRAALIGTVVAGLSGFLLWSYLKRFEDEASGGPRVAVLTVVRTVEPGTVLKDADIGERSIPQAYVESRMIRATDRAQIANLRVWTNLDAAQVLNWSDIIASAKDRNLSAVVQHGMRAVTIHTESNATALVHPGDRVDVIATVQAPGSNEHRTGIILLQNVLVLGRAQTQGMATANASEVGGDIALSLTPQKAQLLAVANDKAKLSIALRSPDDVKELERPSEIDSKSLVTPAERPVVLGGPRGPINMGNK